MGLRTAAGCTRLPVCLLAVRVAVPRVRVAAAEAAAGGPPPGAVATSVPVAAALPAARGGSCRRRRRRGAPRPVVDFPPVVCAGPTAHQRR